VQVSGNTFPNTLGDGIPTDFVALAGRWCANFSVILLNFVWHGYDQLLKDLPAGIDDRDLERSITESLELRIQDVMSGYEPYTIQHGPYERETMKLPPAQPPQYDLAFKIRNKEWIMWPLEAKVLETDGAVGDYKNDVTNEFLTCRYAPFSSEGAMLGYLLAGTVESVFNNLEAKIPCVLVAHPEFPNRPCKISDHTRRVEVGKPYPAFFRCHHLIMEFSGLTRSQLKGRAYKRAAPPKPKGRVYKRAVVPTEKMLRRSRKRKTEPSAR
jgi:hypothetical protein